MLHLVSPDSQARPAAARFGRSLARASDAFAVFCAAEYALGRHRNFVAQMRFTDLRCAIQLNTLVAKLLAAETALVAAVRDAGGDVIVDGVRLTLDTPQGRDRRSRPRIVITYGY